ncbi:helix-turn-helix domain-containing protein [Zooshikella marina]|uniref:helix-turn-helix domain-containing protein n=1 Tax=Zooshikella ganghwensis TaxID=202772 RepID=UPI001BAFC99A|nr:helix-turn-helix domain-containing protein [Zooshikella ganghwensis]MBU2708850.1 helix-turn-helix domain-containing protein [Zooshikella ganghwensis]
MSSEATNAVKRLHITATQKLLLLLMADFVSAANVVEISYNTLVKLSRCSRKTVINNIGELVEKDFLVKLKRKKETGEPKVNQYWLKFVEESSHFPERPYYSNEKNQAANDYYHYVAMLDAQKNSSEPSIKNSPPSDANTLPRGVNTPPSATSTLPESYSLQGCAPLEAPPDKVVSQRHLHKDNIVNSNNTILNNIYNPINTSSKSVEQKLIKKNKRRKKYSDEFEELWKLRPRRLGDDPKHKAYKAYCARRREGHTHEEILAGLIRYKKYLDFKCLINTEFTKQLATFLGPNKAFLEPWAIPQGGLTKTKQSLVDQAMEENRQRLQSQQYQGQCYEDR